MESSIPRFRQAFFGLLVTFALSVIYRLGKNTDKTSLDMSWAVSGEANEAVTFQSSPLGAALQPALSSSVPRSQAGLSGARGCSLPA